MPVRQRAGRCLRRGSRPALGASAEILAPEESYCPSDQSRSDHRPALALFQLSDDGHPSARQRVFAQIQRLEAELSALKALVEEMPQ